MSKPSAARFLVFYFGCSVICNLVHPVTPTFLQSINCPDSMFGIAFAAMAIANFFTAPFWGWLGEHYGYIRAIGLSYLGYAAGQCLFGSAPSWEFVILGRMFSGAFASGMGVCSMAYMAYIAKNGTERANNMINLTVVMTVGGCTGYLCGGFLGDLFLGLGWGVRPVFYAQCLWLAIYVVIFTRFLPEGERELSPEAFSFAKVNPVSAFAGSIKHVRGALLLFLFITLLSSFATNAQDQSLNYFLKAQLQFPPSYNGLFKAGVGAISLVTNLTINRWLVRKTDSRKSIIPVFAIAGALMLGVALIEQKVVFLIFALSFNAFNSMYLPIQQALVMRNSKGSKGEISGIFNATKAAGMCLGPLYSGIVFASSPRAPFFAAAAAFLCAAALSVVSLIQYRREEEPA